MEDFQNVCEKDEEHGLSQLHLASETSDSGDLETVRSLLLLSANVDLQVANHNTPLHNATKYGHIHVINVLLNKHANVNSRNAFGQTSLHLAAEIGHLEIVQLLLDSHADVHATDKFMNTPIHIAAMHGHSQLVQLFMKYSVLLICYGNRPLHLAAKCGHVQVVQLLLNYDENPDVTNLDGDTSLHLASANDHLEVVMVLLRNNADIISRNASSKTPLHCAAEMGFAEIVKALVDREGDVNTVDTNGDTALHLAASNGHIAVVNVLLNQTTEADVKTHSQSTVDQVPANEFSLSKHPFENKVVDADYSSHPFTAEGGAVEMSDTLLSHSSKAKTAFKIRLAPLRPAVNQRHANIGENLIFNGANVNACNNVKKTPLHLACQNGHTSIVEILLDNHATVDVMTQSHETPFYLAAANGHAAVTDLLLRRGVGDFVLANPRKETPLHVAVKNGHVEVVKAIFKHCCRISEKLLKDGKQLHEDPKRGIMPIELFKRDGRRVSAEIVWTERQTPLETKRDSDGFSPLVYAGLNSDPKMVHLLLSVGECLYSESDIVDSFRTITTQIPFGYCDAEKYRLNLIKTVQFLINSSKFNAIQQDSQLNSLLHNVMEQKYPLIVNGCVVKWSDRLRLQIKSEVIQLLLEKGADFNMKNSAGETPLMIASENGCCEVIQTLFDWEENPGLKVDIDARDENGETALIKAVVNRHVSVMRLLLNHNASVNLYDYYGHTALHAVFYDPTKKWFDRNILDKTLCRRNFNEGENPKIDHSNSFAWEEDRNTAIDELLEILEHDEKTTRIEEEMVKLLLDYVEIDVNARDFRGNTPLELAMKSSKSITSATFEALKNRGAILNLLDLEEEAPIGEIMVDEKGRNPLHLLIISRVSHNAEESEKGNPIEQKCVEILLSQNIFRAMANAADEKGRIPLHYATFKSETQILNLGTALLKLGSNLNAADMYGKTLLHYVESNNWYEFLVQHGASENIKDKNGHTPKELKRLRESVTNNERNADDTQIEKKALCISADIAKALKQNQLTELSKQKLVEAIRIYSQSPRPQESSEEAIWKIWTEIDFFRLNRRLSQLKPFVHRFMERLADGIKEKDGRFECQPNLVGSALEETKVTISGDFDFIFKLIKFNHICDPFPHPLGPKGYFQLRRRPNKNTRIWSDEMFSCFFNSDQCLLTNEVNSRFKIILDDVLCDYNFWKDEQFLQCSLSNRGYRISLDRKGLCKTVKLRMLNPIEDGEGDFLFLKLSIDIAACVHVEDYWPEDPLPVGINPVVKTDGCTFVFHRPRSDPSTPGITDFFFSDTFARISFALADSRIIKESPPLMKAAYIVCKTILYGRFDCHYELKTCLFFCLEALTTQNSNETRNEVEITSKELVFWVDRIMFCFAEFYRHKVYPVYLMPSFILRSAGICYNIISSKTNEEESTRVSISYSSVYDIYLDLCPDDAVIEIPVLDNEDHVTRERFSDGHHPCWEQFDRVKFMRRLSSRCRNLSVQ